MLKLCIHYLNIFVSNVTRNPLEDQNLLVNETITLIVYCLSDCSGEITLLILFYYKLGVLIRMLIAVETWRMHILKNSNKN